MRSVHQIRKRDPVKSDLQACLAAERTDEEANPAIVSVLSHSDSTQMRKPDLVSDRVIRGMKRKFLWLILDLRQSEVIAARRNMHRKEAGGGTCPDVDRLQYLNTSLKMTSSLARKVSVVIFSESWLSHAIRLSSHDSLE